MEANETDGIEWNWKWNETIGKESDDVERDVQKNVDKRDCEAKRINDNDDNVNKNESHAKRFNLFGKQIHVCIVFANGAAYSILVFVWFRTEIRSGRLFSNKSTKLKFLTRFLLLLIRNLKFQKRIAFPKVVQKCPNSQRYYNFMTFFSSLIRKRKKEKNRIFRFQ